MKMSMANNPNPAWNLHTDAKAPNLKELLDKAYENLQSMPDADSGLSKRYYLSPLSTFKRKEIEAFVSAVLTGVEARKFSYTVVLVPANSRNNVYDIRMLTTFGNKARIPEGSRVVLERRF